jgi:hypothetical protein
MGRVDGAPGTSRLLADGEHALVDEGSLHASRQWFEAAYRAAEAEGDGEAMGRAAIGLGGLWVHEHRSAAADALTQRRQNDALVHLDPGSVTALRLRARLAGEADYRNGTHADILKLLDEARHAGDPIARAEALSLAHHCVLGPDFGELRAELAQELLGVAALTGRRSDRLMGLLWRTVDLFLDDDPHAGRGLGELRGALAGAGHHAIGFVARAIEVMLTIRAGRFADAEILAADCAERGAAAGDVDATGWHGAQLVAIRWYQGRIAELVPMLRDLVDSPTLSAVDNSYFAALAVAAAGAGDRRQAAAALARLRGHDLADLPRSSSWLVLMNGVVEAAHLIGDSATAARAYELLSPFARLPMMASLGVACFGSAHHALGVAALTTGDPDRAVHHFHTAIHRNLAIGHWPAAALSRWRLGQALTATGDTTGGEREAALAAQEAAGLGMRLPGTATVEAAAPVAALVAAGQGQPEAGPRVRCRRHGSQWRLEFGARSVLVAPSVGLAHLATLLAHPGHELPAIDLAAGSERPAVTAGPLGGGDPARRFTGSEERARIAVGKAIRRAIRRVAAADPVIGEELRATVQTGLRCCYRPS